MSNPTPKSDALRARREKQFAGTKVTAPKPKRKPKGKTDDKKS
jgi:hypothetical protein